MKNRIFLALILIATCRSLNAQSNWELGGRLGDNFALDITIPLAASPRLHPAIYVGHEGAVGTYFDWLFKLSGGPQGLKFYPGVGPEIYFGNNAELAAAGDFGAEYSFDFPLTVGLDWRPRIVLTEGMNYYGGNWGITFRFRFGEGVKFVKVK